MLGPKRGRARWYPAHVPTDRRLVCARDPRSRRRAVAVSSPRHLVRYCVVPQENDTGKRPTSKNLIKGLEENVRKVLETKRNEYDRTHFQLQQKQKELAELQLQLGDLAKDGAALGLDEYPDEQQRLAAIKSISNRKVFTKHTVRGTHSPGRCVGCCVCDHAAPAAGVPRLGPHAAACVCAWPAYCST